MKKLFVWENGDYCILKDSTPIDKNYREYIVIEPCGDNGCCGYCIYFFNKGFNDDFIVDGYCDNSEEWKVYSNGKYIRPIVQANYSCDRFICRKCIERSGL